jgi:YgiT-type zinc finger domain-containing protein
MKCTSCKTGEMKPGTTVIPYSQGEITILVKDVQAQVCDQCGAWYVDPDTLESVREIIQKETNSGHEVSVVTMKKAA